MMGSSVLLKRQRIYQIYCGRWEKANIIDHKGKVLELMSNFDWNQIRDRLGLNTIYLLGLWDVTGPVIVNDEEGVDLSASEDRCPSAFAITDYTKVWPSLGSNNDLIELIEVIHSAGMKVVVDFVANHTGLEHPWVRSNPEFYKQDVNGLSQTAFSGDVVELNYNNPQVWIKMIEAAIAIAEMGIDGFRCDMAHLVPVKFWDQLTQIIKKINPDFYFIGESYDQSVFDHTNRLGLLEAGFDSIYDSGLYQNLKSIGYGSDLNNLVAHVNYVNSTGSDSWVHYASNHDDKFSLDETEIGPVMSLLLTLYGDMLIYNGFESGFGKRLAHHRVEILPDKYVSDQISKDVSNWIKFCSQKDLIISAYEAVDNAYIRAKWQLPEAYGYILINFSDQICIDDISNVRLEPYSSLRINYDSK